jgi:nicotinate phosphoribosyltransferase
VYKLVRIGGSPRLKVTSDIAKATLPDRKRLVRAIAPDGSFLQDVISLADEEVKSGDTVFNPVNPLQQTAIPANARFVEVRSAVMVAGKRSCPSTPTLAEMADRCAEQLARLPQGCLRLINPHRYKVSISGELNDLRIRLMEKVLRRN